MGVIDNELVAMPTEIANVNAVKDLVLGKLEQDGVLTPDQVELYANKHHIIIIKDSWFKELLKRLKKDKKGGYYYRYVKFDL